MNFYVTSRKEWILNPDRKFGGWWKRHYVVIYENVVRRFSDGEKTNYSETNFTADEIAAKLFPEYFTGQFATRVYTGMAA